ncbi:hypothetical protein MIND_01078300 [Mycena indigotica]|uniref:Uncharacterized protein n=1 Tax=Mycena indigotica TaxID=2126181 RepID=A0A8H6SAI1_9AGAR|nr:uncharacterized protein MIND_01078300 [Mycena indigotica]KAF7295387.1 hypothetical protein MIND_01078300 [Mycena indigotica]
MYRMIFLAAVCGFFSSPNMSSSNNISPSSALYQYAIPAGLFLVGAVTLAFYFRSRANAQEARERAVMRAGGIRVGVRGQDDDEDQGPRPVLVDAYLSSAGEGAGGWERVMPLATSVTRYTAADSKDSAGGSAPTRVRVGVVVVMPAPHDDDPLPQLELGLLETELLPTPALTPGTPPCAST